jgi:aminoglycoside 3-N-acetyltransferase
MKGITVAMEEYVKYCDIINHLDIYKGDVVYISSDITTLAWSCRENGEDFDSNTFIDSIIDKVGVGGTILFPTFNWDFSSYGKTFDYYKTPSQVGSLTNIALKRKDFKRTRHPTNSFAVWGKDQEYLCGLTNVGAYSIDSPFGYMYENKAKNLLIAVGLGKGFSFFHFVENQETNPKFRFHKDFKAGYIDINGIETQRTYSIYVRRFELDMKYIMHLMEKPLADSDAFTCKQINSIDYKIVDLYKAYSVFADEINLNNSKRMYTYTD